MTRIITIIALTLTAATAASASSPWLEKVYEYVPAPGEFVNQLPEYEEGDNYEDMLDKVREQLCGDRMPGAVTLGAFGGYVTVGFDHPVVNVKGEYDFKIFGNAIISDADRRGGSAEPAIVWVSEDVNANGLPDDPWYELAGSEYDNPATCHDAHITYFPPDAHHTPEPDASSPAIVDAHYIRYTTNVSGKSEGYVPRVQFHNQPYWPGWLGSGETLQFSAPMLPDNFVNRGTDTEPYYVQLCYDYGYADNLPNDVDQGFDISRAVDADGTPHHLNGIHFIRIHTAVCQFCGWLGETSSEICGGQDLHPEAVYTPTVVKENILTGMSLSVRGTSLYVSTPHHTLVQVVASDGRTLFSASVTEGSHVLQLPRLAPGVYVARTDCMAHKFVSVTKFS